jgi:hypothetical protein
MSVEERGMGWFRLPLGQGVNNLHIFSIEKKAKRKRRRFYLKNNIKSYMF